MTTTTPPRYAPISGPDRIPGQHGAPPGSEPPSRQSFATRVVRGAPEDPAWARPALFALLAVTAVLYLWNLSASGYANSFYAAAAQAASVSWKAWFFGSFDASSFITVDKPPASTWVMGLSGRIFGFSSWSMLVPQALEGVAAVGLLYGAVRRWSGPAAGLLAGAALALTPAAALIFRFNNPDALLTLLLVAAAYCLVRALEQARTRWLLLAGSAVGFAFLAKMMQAFLPLPAFVLVYLVCAPTPLRRRLLQLIGALGALIVSAGWWIAVVELWPASSRPYIGGSQTNSILELVLGYNGLGRILGGDGNGGGGGGGSGSSFGGATGITRLFRDEMGNEISWLLPAALIALVVGLIALRSAPRTDRARASLILWGGWLLGTGLTLSFMKGTVHPYYTVALAPSIAALVAIGGRELWIRRADWFARFGLAAMVLFTGLWSYTLLARNDDWHPELRYLVLALSVLVTVGLLIPGRRSARALVVLALVGTMAGLAGTTAYAVTTAGTAHTGSIPSVGPAGTSSGGGMGGGTGRGIGGGAGGRGTGGGTGADSSTGSTELTALLKAAGTRWAAATVGSSTAASLQLAGGEPVMAIGGFNGGDPAPTLAAFQKYVADGDVRYFVAGGGMGGGGRGGNSEIATWVAANYTATTIGGQTVYDLQS
jgi:4-amino-4-deoxy-L-arabinose transferase-like glycosyltransferase